MTTLGVVYYLLLTTTYIVEHYSTLYNIQKYFNKYTVQIWVREAFLHTKLKAMIFAP